MAKSRRRQAGEGSISEYATDASPRFLLKYWAPQSDGTRKQVLRRGFRTRKAAAEALREQLANIDRGTHVAPSRMTVEQHFATWLDGLHKGPTTVASYWKNDRSHVVPHIGEVKLAALTARGLPRPVPTAGDRARHDGAGALRARTVRYIHTTPQRPRRSTTSS